MSNNTISPGTEHPKGRNGEVLAFSDYDDNVERNEQMKEEYKSFRRGPQTGRGDKEHGPIFDFLMSREDYNKYRKWCDKFVRR